MTLNNKTLHYPYSSSDLQTLFDNNVSGYPVYIGKARAGAETSAAEWQIKKITYDGSGNITSVKFASGNNNYVSSWDDRASYTY